MKKMRIHTLGDTNLLKRETASKIGLEDGQPGHVNKYTKFVSPSVYCTHITPHHTHIHPPTHTHTPQTAIAILSTVVVCGCSHASSPTTKIICRSSGSRFETIESTPRRRCNPIANAKLFCRRISICKAGGDTLVSFCHELRTSSKHHKIIQSNALHEGRG